MSPPLSFWYGHCAIVQRHYYAGSNVYSSLQWSIGQLVLGGTNSLDIFGLFGVGLEPQLVNSVSFSILW